VHFKALFLAETRRGHSLPRSAKRRISKALDLIHNTQENETCCGAWRDQAGIIFAKKGGFCNFEQNYRQR